MPSELSTKNVARKSLVVSSELQAGDTLTEDNLTIKRPGNGIAPKYYYQSIGKKVNKKLEAESVLTKDDIE